VVAAPGTTRVVLQNLTTDGVENDAVRSFSPDARIVGGTITGGSTGITVGATTTISGTSITRSAGQVSPPRGPAQDAVAAG
jgi:hypothetical protein